MIYTNGRRFEFLFLFALRRNGKNVNIIPASKNQKIWNRKSWGQID